nr:putative wax ester synthase/acyl-CoA:diacylglycerol acyltransferase [uncultured bacterium]
MGVRWSESLTATDASFLRIESDHEPQHVGSLSILEGDPLRDGRGGIDIARLMAHVGRRLHRVPRLRHRIMEVPLRQGRPVWVDDPTFDLDYHVRLTSLARPGDDAQLSTLMGRLQSLPLDRRRPLWEMWFVDGLESGDVGLIIKTHHALGDGIANVDLALALVDVDRAPAADPDPPAWEPRPAPEAYELLAEGVQHQFTLPFRLGRAAFNAVREPRPAIDSAADVMRTVSSFARRPPKAPWNEAVTPHRRWERVDIPFEMVDRIREHTSATVNDVVLAACTGSIRQFLVEHGHDVDERDVRAMVPVSRRADHEHGATLGNKISLIIVALPVDEADPVVRLERLHRLTSDLKADDGLMDGAQRIIELADVVPTLAVPLTRFVSRSIPMNLVITNVPGPPVPLFLQGARILRTYPYVEVIDNEGLTMAVVSYDDQLFFGLTSDRDVLPDLGRLAAGIAEEFQAMLAALASHTQQT